jgi:hypothetical protein
MQETPEQKQLPLDSEQLGLGGFFSEMFQGIGKMLGLALLWSLEEVRDVFFAVLDRFNVKARPHGRVSAFPPGSPRRRKVA